MAMTPITWYLASGNTHKAEEFQAMLRAANNPVELQAATALGGMPDVDESAGTFAGNATLKALALAAIAPQGTWVLADDSGLAVDALDGAPGVHSARYAGPSATDADNCNKLLNALANIPTGQRTARFVCVLAILPARTGNATTALHFEGTCQGHITYAPKGENGFGYDPLFVPHGHTKTFAELGPQIKDNLSHRARAVEKLLEHINKMR